MLEADGEQRVRGQLFVEAAILWLEFHDCKLGGCSGQGRTWVRRELVHAQRESLTLHPYNPHKSWAWYRTL